MNTVQKAFVFIVLVLAVLTMAASVVLFSERTNWKGSSVDANKQLADTKADLAKNRADLKEANALHQNRSQAYDAELAGLKTDLTTLKNALESTQADKAQMETLVADLKTQLNLVGNSMETLGTRTAELEKAKIAAEAELEKMKASASQAEENLTIAERKVRDQEAKIDSMNGEITGRDDQIRLLNQKVAVLGTYAPPLGPVVAPSGKAPVHGKVSGIERNGDVVFLSVGADDGVVNGMLMLIYKADGTYVATAKVYDVIADKSAARVVQPVVGTISEGDNVVNK